MKLDGRSVPLEKASNAAGDLLRSSFGPRGSEFGYCFQFFDGVPTSLFHD